MANLFQHRHYAKIASIIAELSVQPQARELIALQFARALLGTNPNYDFDRFFNAAIGKAEGRDK